MELNYLREFIALTETRNFAEAADRLFISQSSLSKHIQSLESEIGTPLLRRTTRKVDLNEQGEIFLTYAKRIVQAQDDCAAAIQSNLSASTCRLRVGVPGVMGIYGIPDILCKFRENTFGFDCEILEEEPDVLLKMLEREECDLIFYRDMPISGRKSIWGNYNTISFATDTSVAVFPRNHRLAANQSVTLTDLKDESLIVESSPFIVNFMKEQYNLLGIEANITHSSRWLENVLDMVSLGLGCSLVTAHTMRNMTRKDIAVVPVDPPITDNLLIVYRKGTALSAVAQYFIDCAMSDCAPY